MDYRRVAAAVLGVFEIRTLNDHNAFEISIGKLSTAIEKVTSLSRSTLDSASSESEKFPALVMVNPAAA